MSFLSPPPLRHMAANFFFILSLCHSLRLSLCPACFSWFVAFWGFNSSQRQRVPGQCFEKVQLPGSVPSVPTVTGFHSEGRETIQLISTIPNHTKYRYFE